MLSNEHKQENTRRKTKEPASQYLLFVFAGTLVMQRQLSYATQTHREAFIQNISTLVLQRNGACERWRPTTHISREVADPRRHHIQDSSSRRNTLPAKIGYDSWQWMNPWIGRHVGRGRAWKQRYFNVGVFQAWHGREDVALDDDIIRVRLQHGTAELRAKTRSRSATRSRYVTVRTVDKKRRQMRTSQRTSCCCLLQRHSQSG